MGDPDSDQEGIHFRDIMRKDNTKCEPQADGDGTKDFARSPSARRPEAEKPMQPNGAKQAVKRILFVDDDFTNRQRCGRWFESEGKGRYEMIEAEEASVALVLLKNEHFDLVIVDSLTPDMGCIEFVEHAKEIIREKAEGKVSIILMNELPRINEHDLQRLPPASRPDAMIRKSYSTADLALIERLIEKKEE
jgi:CheY-like chemotaxis protein